MNVPILESPHLRLRGHRVSDFDACAALWANPDTVRFIGNKPNTREESWLRMLRHAGNWALAGYGSWLVEEKTTGAFAGEVGFMTLKRDIVPSLEGFPEIGWVVAPALHGRGYASEAVAAALAWSDTNLKGIRTACIIDPANAPSLRVAEKNGYREFARTTLRGDTVVLLER